MNIKRITAIGAIAAAAGLCAASGNQTPQVQAPIITSDGTQDAESALAEVREVLARHRCQLGLVVQVGGNGEIRPLIVVQDIQSIPRPHLGTGEGGSR